MGAPPSLTELARAYTRERAASGDFAKTTMVNVRCDLQAFAAHADVDPADLRLAHVQAWLDHACPARSTRRRRFSYVKLFLIWLERHGHIASNPLAGVKAPRVVPPVPRGLPAEAVSRLVRSAPDARARFVLVWMAQLGLRCCEVSRLELADIDLEGRSVRITGKGGWERVLPVVEEAWSALAGYLTVRGTKPGRLVNVTPNHLSRLVSRWMAEAGVPGTAHNLRHSMATSLLRERGADIKDVQAALGHQALTSTAVYLPFSDVERLRAVMEGRWYGNPDSRPLAG